jgi:hypothetical protein
MWCAAGDPAAMSTSQSLRRESPSESTYSTWVGAVVNLDGVELFPSLEAAVGGEYFVE